MILRDIFTVESCPELHQQYTEIYRKVKEKYKRDDLIDKYTYKPSYARATYTGKLKDGVDITELELSMLLDNGFSHFGGSSSISANGNFTVVIYTD